MQLTIDHSLTTRRLLNIARYIFIYIFLSIFAIFFLMPFYYSVVASFMPVSDLYHLPLYLFPPHPTLANFTSLFTGTYPVELGTIKLTIFGALFNSTFIGVTYAVGAVFFCTLGGFAFAKYRFRGRDGLFALLLATLMVPASLGLIPGFIIMARLGWVNTWLPLIVPGMANAFGIFWMRQYMSSVPDELIDAAHIDGAGEFGTFWRIVLPIVSPALSALAIYMFLNSWNSLLAPLIYIKSELLFTTPVFLMILSGTAQYRPVHLVITASVITIVPIVIVFIAMQRQFVAGITMGAIK
jgi:multiple sugar transport system permease protein